MRILYFTFYFAPDLCAGSFRNTPLVDELAAQLSASDHIHVVTTQPNRYKTFQIKAPAQEQRIAPSGCRITIDRIAIPAHTSGMKDQIRSFMTYYREAFNRTRTETYDLVVASSSRLFTAFLGAQMARQRWIPLFLDIRDLFRETILEVVKSPLARAVLNPVLRLIEQYTFGYAQHINLVSEGFKSYFAKYKTATYSYFTNGIDDEFLHFSASVAGAEKPFRTLVYAGNIGEGQGLHKIIPGAARQLGHAYRFIIVGDGGAKAKLEAAIARAGVSNVELREPLSRKELVALYREADYLFMHLNDLKAFERVLPSKLFEYAATDKPIVAGVAGYAHQFLRDNVSNCLLFQPGNVDALVEQLWAHPPVFKRRKPFRERFQRKKIMHEMARCILRTANYPGPEPLNVVPATASV